MWSPISNTQLRVPPGFGNLLEAFAREVIRKQPANICAFGAAFFESMLAERQRTGEKDVAQLGAVLEDRSYCEQLRQMSAEQQCREDPLAAEEMHVAARKIQALYRGHLVRRQSLRDRAQMMAGRPSLPSMHLTYGATVEPLKELVEDSLLELPSQPASAPRSAIESPLPSQVSPPPSTQDNTEEDDKIAAAALKIQRVYRAHLERRRSSAVAGLLPAKERGSYTPAEPSAPPFSPMPEKAEEEPEAAEKVEEEAEAEKAEAAEAAEKAEKEAEAAEKAETAEKAEEEEPEAAEKAEEEEAGEAAEKEKDNEGVDYVDGQPSASGRRAPSPHSPYSPHSPRSSAASPDVASANVASANGSTAAMAVEDGAGEASARTGSDKGDTDANQHEQNEQKNEMDEIYEDAAEFSPAEQQLLAALMPATPDAGEEQEQNDIQSQPSQSLITPNEPEAKESVDADKNTN